MKKILVTLALCALALPLLFAACSSGGTERRSLIPKEKIDGGELYVRKVENLPEDFILGMDVSSVLAEEDSGVKYYDFEGKQRDLFEILAENGVTHIRVRVWNDPYTADGKGYGGGNNDIGAAVKIGERATAVGMKLIVDFHYSDFWADPGKQMVPKAWKGMDVDTKANALHDYTVESLQKLKTAGVDVAMVQIGNETNGSFCGESTWFNMSSLFEAGSKAVRETLPDALVALHFANPEKAGSYIGIAGKLAYYNIDYDVFASSYYPFWHGTLDNLGAVLTEVAETYGKKTMVIETSYAYTDRDSDFSANTISGGGGITKDYPFTVQGQANCFRNVVDTVAHKAKNGIGVVYWEGAWITVDGASWEENSKKWEEFGSGWASSYAAEYDPKDAGQYYGGSAVDNQTFFDENGKPLESLRVFNLVRYGNEIEARVDAIADTELVFDLNGQIVLPDKVNAVMTDDSRREVDVTWNVTEADIVKMKTSGAAKYTFTGTADGREALLNISMVEFNFLENYSFETGDLTGWKLTDLKKADELYVEDKKTDSLTGDKHMHFWSAASDSVEFALEQTPKDLPAGTYKFTISIMGGDAGESEIYAYAKVNGQIVKTEELQITYYNEWHTAVVEGVTVGENEELSVGVFVKCAGAGNGAWGKIDDALLNSVKESDDQPTAAPTNETPNAEPKVKLPTVTPTNETPTAAPTNETPTVAPTNETQTVTQTAGPVDPDVYDGSEVTVVFYHPFGINLRELLDRYIDEFNKLYPNIHIRGEAVGSYEDIRDQIMEYPLSMLPGVALCRPDAADLFYRSGLLTPLDGFIGSDKQIGRNDDTKETFGLTAAQADDLFAPSGAPGTQAADGRTISMPLFRTAPVLYYNKTFFDEHGLTPPATWEETEALCRRIKEIDPACVPLGVDNEKDFFITLCEQYGSPCFDAGENHFLFDNDVNRAFTARFARLYSEGLLTTSLIYGTYISTPFADGKCLLAISDSGHATHYLRFAEESGSEIGVAPLPQVDPERQRTLFSGADLCVFGNRDKQEVYASWLFVKYLTTNPSFQAEFALAANVIPTVGSAADVPAYRAFLGSAETDLCARVASVCLDRETTCFEAPVFAGSFDASYKLGLLFANCLYLPQNGGFDAALGEIFENTVAECREIVERFGHGTIRR